MPLPPPPPTSKGPATTPEEMELDRIAIEALQGAMAGSGHASTYPDWPYEKGKIIKVFAIDRSRGPSHIRLVTITLMDRRVVRVEYGQEDLEAVVYGRAEISITQNPIE